MIQCPRCGSSYYEEGVTTSTAMYFPPIWKDGVNVNPDRNIHTTSCKCCNCNCNFYIERKGHEITIGEPGKSPTTIMKQEQTLRLDESVIKALEKRIEKLEMLVQKIDERTYNSWEWPL